MRSGCKCCLISCIIIVRLDIGKFLGSTVFLDGGYTLLLVKLHSDCSLVTEPYVYTMRSWSRMLGKTFLYLGGKCYPAARYLHGKEWVSFECKSDPRLEGNTQKLEWNFKWFVCDNSRYACASISRLFTLHGFQWLQTQIGHAMLSANVKMSSVNHYDQITIFLEEVSQIHCKAIILKQI